MSFWQQELITLWPEPTARFRRHLSGLLVSRDTASSCSYCRNTELTLQQISVYNSNLICSMCMKTLETISVLFVP